MVTKPMSEIFLGILWVEVGGSPLYRVERKIGEGSLEQVCKGRLFSCEKGSEPVEVAQKFEHKIKLVGLIKDDYPTDSLGGGGGTHGAPTVHYKGIQRNYFIMVMEHSGPILLDVWSLNNCTALHHRPRTVFDVGYELILISHSCYLRYKSFVDFGIATEWRNSCEGKHIEYTEHPWHTKGTLEFASRLPWRKSSLEEKFSTSPDLLCFSCYAPLKEYLGTVLDFNFSEEPNYCLLLYVISIFDGLIGANFATKLLNTDGAQR
ncbi:unnamed protein product [Coffea canephora]|uniref:DH200=94 genomic scaffold, scaffold_301 n=1 Tax=Coffea canephora TaxID=49390 RepID=A0A068VEB9_COFCA|nr:unnamed protein product [Coffea canephora]